MFGGLLVDEWATSSTFVQNQETDQRSSQLNNGTINTELPRALPRATDANQAIELLNKYKPLPASDVAEMYFARGFAEFTLASDFLQRHSAQRRRRRGYLFRQTGSGEGRFRCCDCRRTTQRSP
jgi:hypothetical protein